MIKLMARSFKELKIISKAHPVYSISIVLLMYLSGGALTLYGACHPYKFFPLTVGLGFLLWLIAFAYFFLVLYEEPVKK